MRLWSGTSGWNYDAWRGPFYPEETDKDARLEFYAQQLCAVEVNNTFYRVPKTDVVERWTQQVSADFRFVLKCSRRVTHFSRLKNTEETMHYMWRAAQALAAHRGPMLFQLPPNLRKDTPRLADFLASLPEDCRPVVEFRHASWFDDETFEVLRNGGAALCHADKDGDDRDSELVATADWGYFRLRRPDYGAEELDRWAADIQAQPWREAYVFFKHEDDGAAPRMARDFATRFPTA